jgi:hypothetical protein
MELIAPLLVTVAFFSAILRNYKRTYDEYVNPTSVLVRKYDMFYLCVLLFFMLVFSVIMAVSTLINLFDATNNLGE